MYIYIMQTVSIGISGIGMMQFLNTFCGNIFYYGTPENKWKADVSALRATLAAARRERHESLLYRAEHVLDAGTHMGWLAPILVWSAFIVVLLWVMLCLNVLVRRQWMDQERLSFPITQIPLEI